MPSNLASSLLKVKSRVLDEHRGLRTWLERLELCAIACARAPDVEDARAHRLRIEARGFVAAFERHLAYEDSRLVPLIARIDDWGPKHAAAMRDEHRDQRARLREIVHQASMDDAKSLAVEVSAFARSIRADMNGEERDLRVLGEEELDVAPCSG